jgi:predicted esterase
VFGADVTLSWQPGSHALARQDVAAAYEWLEAGKPED